MLLLTERGQFEMGELRKICAVITVDEDVMWRNMETNGIQDTGTLDYLAHEFKHLGWSGITLGNAMITDYDDISPWARYTNYILDWAFSLPEESPVPYEKWLETNE